ncbi:hypothetical protein Droror1_Dr00010329 [Drosera rotundifolia]
MKATTTLKDQEAALSPKVTGHDQKGTVCRICQLESDRAFSLRAPSVPTNLILLGCGCKGELASAHSHCAEAWFTVRGNRLGEICGETAENVTGLARDRFMEDWNEGGSAAYDSNTADRGRGSWTGQPWCNLLRACLVIAFVLSWFLRID